MILLVEADPCVRSAVLRALESATDVVAVSSLQEARGATSGRAWRGVVVGVAQTDGDGLEWLASERRAGHDGAALAIARDCPRELVNRALGLGASLICEPIDDELVRSFARRAYARPSLQSEASRILRALADAHALTRRELDLLSAAVQGVTRESFVEERGISMNTYKTVARRALRKLRACNVGEVRDAVLREAWGGGS